MNRKIITASGITVVAVIVAAFFIFSLSNNASQVSDTQVQVQKTETPKINILDTMTIPNATDPSFGVDHKTGIVYASYYKGSGHTFGSYEMETANVYMMKSYDDGKTFSLPIQVNDKDGDASPGGYTNPIQISPSGEVFIAWQQVDEHPQFFGIYNIRLAKSTDGGSSFSPAVDPGKNLEASEKLYPELAVSGKGTILIPYINNEFATIKTENGTQIAYNYDNVDLVTQMPVLRSTDGGATFEQFILDKDACQCCDIASTVGPDGEVYFVWRTSDREFTAPNDPTNKHIKYLGGNNTETEFLEWFDDVGKKMYDEGKIDLPLDYSTARDIVVAHTTDGGNGLEWSEPTRVQEKKWMYNGCISIGPGISFDSQGRLHVSYFTGNGEDGKMGYYYVYSDDNGQTFSEPTSLFTADYVAPVHNGAALTVDKNDNVWISFVMLKDYETTENVWSSETEHKMNLNVFAMDRSGKLLDKKTFDVDVHAFASIAQTDKGTILGYTNKHGAQIVTLEI
ncbi:MAG: exo-alpha-sialidase [Nitrosarchaeum sp.]|nr:exo-alpha-sialidase [Nitrosarchaeum sp.]